MRSGAQPTLAHVARAAGVSKTTASASLRDLPGPSAQTKAKVREAAQRLGYRVSVGAKSLRIGMQPTAAVIFDPAIVDREHFVDTYWAQYMNSMILTASAAKVPVIFVSATDTLALEDQLDAVLFMTQDAMIDQLGPGIRSALLANTTSEILGPTPCRNLMHDHASATRSRTPNVRGGWRRPALIFAANEFASV
jgi:hypothetical protein